MHMVFETVLKVPMWLRPIGQHPFPCQALLKLDSSLLYISSSEWLEYCSGCRAREFQCLFHDTNEKKCSNKNSQINSEGNRSCDYSNYAAFLPFLSRDCRLISNLFYFGVEVVILLIEGIDWQVFSCDFRFYIYSSFCFIWASAFWRVVTFFLSCSIALWDFDVLYSILLHLSWSYLIYLVSWLFF